MSQKFSPLCSRFKMLESEFESSLKKSLQIKEDKMAALEARLQESSNLNQQLRQELKTVSHVIKCTFACLLVSHLRRMHCTLSQIQVFGLFDLTGEAEL